MTEPKTKKVKAVTAATLPTTAAEQVVKKAAKEKPAKPAKLKFEAVVSTAKIPAGSVKSTFESTVDYVTALLVDEYGGEYTDYSFVHTSQSLLDAVTKVLAVGMDPTDYLDSYDLVDELPKMEKLFGKDLKDAIAKVNARAAEEEAEEQRAEKVRQEAAQKSAELAKVYAPPVRLKKADIAKATQVLKDAGIEFIDA